VIVRFVVTGGIVDHHFFSYDVQWFIWSTDCC